MKSKQSGFTLVEIAIVLVIVGLLLGGVLKGQELITSSKAKALFADRAAVQTAYNAYNDRFRAIPGDDSAAAARFTGLACGVAGAGASAVNSGAGQSCMNGDGNGLITNIGQGTRLTAAQGAALLVSTQSAAQATANEVYKFWQHLRAAQLIKTDGSGTGEIFMQPLNGALGWTAVNSGGVYVGQQPSSLYLTQFLTPGNVAQAIDGANDDGFTNLGGIRSVSNGGATNPNSQPGAAYIPGTNYNVSMNLL